MTQHLMNGIKDELDFRSRAETHEAEKDDKLRDF